MKLISIFSILAAAVALSSCGGASRAMVNRDGRPTVLRYAYTSLSEEPQAAGQRIEVVRKYLQNQLHVKVEAVETTQYGAVIEAFRANKIDVASISPFSYVIATGKGIPIEAILQGERDGDRDYTGSLVVAADSPIKNIDDLIKHASELTISFVDPDSTSGFLVECAYLQSRGIDPEHGFKKMMFSMNHLASAMTVKAHKVDVAAVSMTMMKRMFETRKMNANDLRILWTSPPIPNQPIAVRKDLPANFKKEIQRAFLEMQQRDPQAWAHRYPKEYASLGRDTIYVPADDATFDGLRQMAKGVKNLSLLDK